MNIIGVHGFSYAPGSKHDDPRGLFSLWTTMLKAEVQGFSYYSYPLGFSLLSLRAYWNAFKRGYWNKYAVAFKEAAPEAADTLASLLQLRWGLTSNIIAHSLGGRVVNLMLKKLPPTKMKMRILILEGAELQVNIPRSLPPGVEVLNICSHSDRILENLGAVFSGQAVDGCIGRDGLGRKMAGWYDIRLDDLKTQARVKRLRGWELDGTRTRMSIDVFRDIKEWGGHWRAYDDPDNALLYQAWLSGADLSDILN